jgi:hypothetical protein
VNSFVKYCWSKIYSKDWSAWSIHKNQNNLAKFYFRYTSLSNRENRLFISNYFSPQVFKEYQGTLYFDVKNSCRVVIKQQELLKPCVNVTKCTGLSSPVTFLVNSLWLFSLRVFVSFVESSCTYTETMLWNFIFRLIHSFLVRKDWC